MIIYNFKYFIGSNSSFSVPSQESNLDILEHTSNILSFSTFIIGILTVMLAFLSYFSYRQFHKVSEIREEAENILQE